jgi:hypothetical protein
MNAFGDFFFFLAIIQFPLSEHQLQSSLQKQKAGTKRITHNPIVSSIDSQKEAKSCKLCCIAT